jgi:hypothetical protein
MLTWVFGVSTVIFGLQMVFAEQRGRALKKECRELRTLLGLYQGWIWGMLHDKGQIALGHDDTGREFFQYVSHEAESADDAA